MSLKTIFWWPRALFSKENTPAASKLNLSKLSYHFKTITCLHVFHKQRDANLVIYDNRSHICVLCGQDDHDGGPAYAWVGLGHLLDADPSLRDVQNLEFGFEAERTSSTAQWSYRPTPPDEEK
jgi:hypothetical protein